MPPKKGRGQRDSDNETESDSQEYIGTFETLRDEGEHFVHVANYKKAIDSFTKAMEFKPNDKQCLVARSRCFLQLGDAQSSLVDAEMALDEDKSFIKGLFQKAEALYVLGDFETSLVFFHRGHKARPELQEFRLGIQKCQEAINNSIGTPESVTLEAKGDLSFFEKQEEKNKKLANRGYSKPQTKKEEKRDRKRPENSGDSKTIKQLLGELYGDKEFLERLLRDESVTGRDTTTSHEVKNLILDGLEYLDTRTEFWRQQKPLYARKRDRELRTMGREGKTGKHANPTRYVLRSLEEIDEAQSQGKYQKSLDKAQKTLKTVRGWSDDEILNREEIIANLHSQIGNANLEMGNYDLALDHHEQDLEIGEQNNLAEAKSRALDNIGRVYARRGDYENAISIWEKKLPLSKSSLESTWLFHELGRCYLEMENFDTAKEYGEKSLSAARDAEDIDWTLHSTVLIAQSEVKLGEYQSAADSFDQALELAQTLGDRKAEDAIKIALEDVNEQIVRGIREDEEDRRSGRGSPQGSSSRSRTMSANGHSDERDRATSRRSDRKDSRDEKSEPSREATPIKELEDSPAKSQSQENSHEQPGKQSPVEETKHVTANENVPSKSSSNEDQSHGTKEPESDSPEDQSNSKKEAEKDSVVDQSEAKKDAEQDSIGDSPQKEDSQNVKSDQNADKEMSQEEREQEERLQTMRLN